uniref:Uncharacterized protein n=1 Tax=viral metagenome TaxID=1070528 RepID=A0A6C0BQW4_9ZZZZ
MPNIAAGGSTNNNWPRVDGENTWIPLNSDGTTAINLQAFFYNTNGSSRTIAVYRVILSGTVGVASTLDTVNLLTSGATVTGNFMGSQTITITPDTAGYYYIMFVDANNDVHLFSLIS